jgi:AraC family transcriptional regulator
MGELYVESLAQVLVIHLLRHHSVLQPAIPDRYSLTHTRLKSAIDYIHAHLGGELSMVQIASSVNTSPTYFASLFKQATGISLHQYVVRQLVERAQLLLETIDLSIANIASKVGFSSPSHLIYNCKRQTGMTPRQIANQTI